MKQELTQGVRKLLPAGAVRLLEEGYRRARVQALLGHASPSTTLVYVQIPDDAMRRAMMAAS